MLQKLSIQNYALINNISIDFSNGFTVITGETGAGKSIILGAIQLLMGARSSQQLLKDSSKKAIVEGVFKSNNNLDKFLSKLELDLEEELLIRREIKPNGSSRTFINDSPVKIDQLKLLSQQIMELNGQHLINEMGSLDFNYSFIDAFLINRQPLEDYNKAYLNYQLYNGKYQNLLEKAKLLNEKKDFLSFQLKELSDYPIENWDEVAINDEFNLVANQEEINSCLSAINNFYNGDNGICVQLMQLQVSFNSLVANLPEITEFSTRLNAVSIEMNDLIEELNKKYTVQFPDKNRLNELDDLMRQIQFLVKKFNVVDLNSLITKRSAIEEELAQIGSLESELIDYKEKRIHWKNKCEERGELLMRNRLENFNKIEKRVNTVLSSISMAHADFKLELTKSVNIHSYGIDDLKLLISVNNKSKYLPIHQFSSGGELSRIALAIKSISTQSKSIPVLIFDEIDTGISGEVASKVGVLLKSIAKNMQVINITHLPQVAAMGKVHFHVEKQDNGNGVETTINALGRKDRIRVLASMLGGNKTGNAARNNALELLN